MRTEASAFDAGQHSTSRMPAPGAPSGDGRLRVLLVDDLDTDAELVERHLQRGGLPVALSRARNRSELEAQLKDRPDLVLLDYTVPGLPGEASLEIVQSELPDVPVIFVTGTIGEERAVELVRGGAADYVLKGRLDRLVPAIARARADAEQRSRRRQLEMDLASAHMRLTQILDRMPGPFLTVDRNLRVTYANDAATAYLDGPVSSLIGGKPWELFARYPDDTVALEVMTEADLVSGSPFDVETYLSGWQRWFEIHGHAIDEGLAVFVRDVTERKQVEHREREMEALLRQAQKVEAIGQLVGGIAHDFNNLLTAIDGFAELALGELPEGEARTDVEEIRRTAARAADLTRRLLAFGRRQVLHQVTIDPGAVVASLLPMLRRTLREDIELEWQPDPAGGHVVVDQSQLEQVLVNLVVNARDAMPSGGHLRIALRTVELGDGVTDPSDLPAGAYVVLSVADTGTGMTDETKEHLFEPFFTTKPAGTGTGLGLATVHGIVYQSGGSISVTTNPGQGTTFEMYLPRASESRLASPMATAPQPPRPLPALRVLLAEDDEAVRKFVKRVLERAGVDVLAAGTPADALALARGAALDVLVSDVVMPGMTGMDLARALQPLQTRMAVLLMSGYVEPRFSEQGVAGEGQVFLSKPFTGDQLIGGIQEALAARADHLEPAPNDPDRG